MYADFSKVYDELMQEIDYGAWGDYLFRITLNAARPIKKVLEFGCGTGNITLELAKKGFEVTAVDLSEEMLTVADEKADAAGLPVRFSKGATFPPMSGRTARYKAASLTTGGYISMNFTSIVTPFAVPMPAAISRMRRRMV